VYACTKILILLDQRDLIKETCRSTQWMVCSGSRKEKLLDSSPTSFQVLQLKTERRFSFFYLSRPAVPQARALKDWWIFLIAYLRTALACLLANSPCFRQCSPSRRPQDSRQPLSFPCADVRTRQKHVGAPHACFLLCTYIAHVNVVCMYVAIPNGTFLIRNSNGAILICLTQYR